MGKQVIELMFSRYRRQLLAQLLLRPDESFHVRELARMTRISAGSVHRELTALYESGLLLREYRGNQVLYRANQESPVYPELASIFRKTMGFSALFRDALAGRDDKIDLAFVFGSMATGRQDRSSDVDVMIIGDLRLVDAVKVLSPLQSKLGREINPVVMTANKFSSGLKKNDRFLCRVIEENKVFIKGNERELAKLVAAGKARRA